MKLNRTPLPVQIKQANEQATVKSSDWMIDDFIEFYCKKHREYLNTEAPWRDQRLKPIARSILRMCDVERYDPEIYIEAQFYWLADFLRSKKMQLYATMLQGEKALWRFTQYMKVNKLKNNNVKVGTKGDPLNDLLMGECLYGETVIRTCLSGNPQFKKIARAVRREINGWNIKDERRKDVRPRALESVLDTLIPGLSLRVHLKRDFKWKEIATFIQGMQ